MKPDWVSKYIPDYMYIFKVLANFIVNYGDMSHLFNVMMVRVCMT